MTPTCHLPVPTRWTCYGGPSNDDGRDAPAGPERRPRWASRLRVVHASPCSPCPPVPQCAAWRWTMGELIRRTAAAEDIIADVRATLTNAAAKGGAWKVLAEERLSDVAALIDRVEGRL